MTIELETEVYGLIMRSMKLFCISCVNEIKKGVICKEVSSFLTRIANKIIASALVRLTHDLNRNFVRADDTRNGSEETATAFTVSQI